MALPFLVEPPVPASRPVRDPYRSAVLVLLATSAAGVAVAFGAGVALANPVMLEAGITLALSSGVLVGVAAAQSARVRRRSAAPALLHAVEAAEPVAAPPGPIAVESVPASLIDAATDAAPEPPPPSPPAARRWTSARVRDAIEQRLSDARMLREIRVVTAGATGFLIVFVYGYALDPASLTAPAALSAAAGCLVAMGLAVSAVRYCSEIESRAFPEAFRLTQGARIVAWIATLAAASALMQWDGGLALVRACTWLVLATNIALCYGLYTARPPAGESVPVFPMDIGVLSVLGERPNIAAGVLDAAQRQLGIDLRSTWALTIVRHSVEPLVIGLGLVGWLSTALTVVAVEEQGLVERLGVPAGGPPLAPGLHVHWPWPIDRVVRLPVQRVQALTVGHEGKEGSGPEDVLWANEHAANEFTLLLGNGRDLITVDAAVQFRIADARVWFYQSQNPADALRAIAHRAVMRTTVNRTLAEALSENVVTTTARMRQMVQADADALGLGVEVLGFTVAGMHPPVAVAPDYQAVVSAELGKITAVVNAEAERNRIVPFAESAAVSGRNGAIAEGAAAAARAAGEAWSFLTLQSQYRASPDEYFYRRRLETLEQVLPMRRLTILDHRFQRDGGELWVTP